MVEINIRYTGDLGCTATHGPSGSTLNTDAPVDNQGKGANFSPTDLIATGLGTCIATTLAIVAARIPFDPSGMTVQVKKEMTSAPPRRIGRLEVVVRIPQELTPEQQNKVDHFAHACPVHRSLHPEVAAPITVLCGAAAKA